MRNLFMQLMLFQQSDTEFEFRIPGEIEDDQGKGPYFTNFKIRTSDEESDSQLLDIPIPRVYKTPISKIHINAHQSPFPSKPQIQLPITNHANHATHPQHKPSEI
jgi:hypothetical protein